VFSSIYVLNLNVYCVGKDEGIDAK
jgi:hypothetical protein